jgi:hypothetical protein
MKELKKNYTEQHGIDQTEDLRAWIDVDEGGCSIKNDSIQFENKLICVLFLLNVSLEHYSKSQSEGQKMLL